MTESERAKAALAALADGEPERTERFGTSDRQRNDVTCESATKRPMPSADEQTAGERAAGTDPSADYHAVIERAVAATEDIEAAAAFVESVGLAGLEAAVRRADREVSGLAADGREALATFERYRVAAAGPVEE